MRSSLRRIYLKIVKLMSNKIGTFIVLFFCIVSYITSISIYSLDESSVGSDSELNIAEKKSPLNKVNTRRSKN